MYFLVRDTMQQERTRVSYIKIRQWPWKKKKLEQKGANRKLFLTWELEIVQIVLQIFFMTLATKEIFKWFSSAGSSCISRRFRYVQISRQSDLSNPFNRPLYLCCWVFGWKQDISIESVYWESIARRCYSPISFIKRRYCEHDFHLHSKNHISTRECTYTQCCNIYDKNFQLVSSVLYREINNVEILGKIFTAPIRNTHTHTQTAYARLQSKRALKRLYGNCS